MNKQILRLAIPNIISNLTVPLLSSVDTALMGHMENVHYLGAIAVGGIIFNFIYWGFGFLRMGTTGLTAQACGRQDDRESISVLSRALLTALFFSLLLILFRNFIVDLSFDLIEASEEVEHYGRLYFSIRILAAPATLGLYALTGWFLGMQNARYPLYLALVTNALNIIFDLVFIKVFDMNVDGVALGTVCANFLGILTAFWLFYRSYGSLRIHIKAAHILDWGRFREFFRVGRDIFIRTLILIFAFSFFTAKSAESGDLLLAVNTILINLWTIMAYGIDGFAFAAESVVGRYIGARQPQNLKKAIWYSFAAGMASAFDERSFKAKPIWTDTRIGAKTNRRSGAGRADQINSIRDAGIVPNSGSAVNLSDPGAMIATHDPSAKGSSLAFEIRILLQFISRIFILH